MDTETTFTYLIIKLILKMLACEVSYFRVMSICGYHNIVIRNVIN